MTVAHVVGARPNFMKAAPVVAALERRGVSQRLVHTGQHYDRNMSAVFFDELGLPAPDVNLGVGSASHARQTAEAMVALEAEFDAHRPDLLLVYGDVNSTLAASLVAAKLGVRLGHVEAGLRSGDRAMPEEINRIVTDRLADLLFTPSVDGNENLVREGVDPSRIHLVGNVMIDTLVRLQPQAEARWPALAQAHGVEAGRYVLVTLHRPRTVDDPDVLGPILAVLDRLADRLPVVFPVHPRTRARIDAAEAAPDNVLLVEPAGYLDFLALESRAALVITDSGGVQEETTYLGVPCLTVRPSTERPITATVGTNRIVGLDAEQLERLAHQALDGNARGGARPLLWDGGAGERVAAIVDPGAGHVSNA